MEVNSIKWKYVQPLNYIIFKNYLKEARWGFPMRYTDDRPHHKLLAETHMNDYDTPEIRCSLRNLSRVTECGGYIPRHVTSPRTADASPPVQFSPVQLYQPPTRFLFRKGVLPRGPENRPVLIVRCSEGCPGAVQVRVRQWNLGGGALFIVKALMGRPFNRSPRLSETPRS